MTGTEAKPWDVEYDNADSRSGGQWFDVGPVQVRFGYDEDYKEHKDIARLVSKVPLIPEMVEALDDAQGMLLLQGVAYDHPDIKRISAILAKVRQS